MCQDGNPATRIMCHKEKIYHQVEPKGKVAVAIVQNGVIYGFNFHHTKDSPYTVEESMAMGSCLYPLVRVPQRATIINQEASLFDRYMRHIVWLQQFEMAS